MLYRSACSRLYEFKLTLHLELDSRLELLSRSTHHESHPDTFGPIPSAPPMRAITLSDHIPPLTPCVRRKNTNEDPDRFNSVQSLRLCRIDLCRIQMMFRCERDKDRVDWRRRQGNLVRFGPMAIAVRMAGSELGRVLERIQSGVIRGTVGPPWERFFIRIQDMFDRKSEGDREYG
jgi:hypothetical protein